MGSDLTTAAHIFKRRFSQNKIDMMTERDHPRWARLRRVPGFTGSEYAYHILTGDPQGVSGTFEDAQNGAESSKGKQPKANRKQKYAVIRVDAEARAASEGDDGAFYNLLVRETKGQFTTMGRNFAFDAYRDGSGIRGQRASVSGNVITLSDPNDVHHFEEGMTLIADNATDGLTPKTGSCKVTGLSTSGTVTVDDVAGISGFADGDNLFRKGDPGTCMDGMAVCTPLVEPTSGDSFRGINRSTNVARLAGSRVTDDGSSTEEKMGLGAIRCSLVGPGHMPTECFVHPLKFWEVSKRQQAKVQFGNPKAQGYRASYGFQFIEIVTPGGTMTMFSDPDCPVSRGYGDKPDNHYVHHLKGLPHLEKQGDSNYTVVYNAAAIEQRAYSWVNYIQEDPAAHFVVEL